MREERFAGNDQAVMATTCVERPSLCCMVTIILMRMLGKMMLGKMTLVKMLLGKMMMVKMMMPVKMLTINMLTMMSHHLC